MKNFLRLLTLSVIENQEEIDAIYSWLDNHPDYYDGSVEWEIKGYNRYVDLNTKALDYLLKNKWAEFPIVAIDDAICELETIDKMEDLYISGLDGDYGEIWDSLCKAREEATIKKYAYNTYLEWSEYGEIL